MNLVGGAAALAAFTGIWFGHAAVRRIEFRSASLGLPMAIFALSGLLLEGLSLSSASLPLSTACGILGITLIWDALEIARQQHRVRRGHAPANPNNPRHARFLAEADSRATCLNPLKREPLQTAESQDPG